VSTSSIAMTAALAQVDTAQVDAFIERGVNEALALALVQGDIIIDHGPDALPLNPHAKPLIAYELEWLAKQPSPSMSRKGAEEAGGVGQTKLIALQALGILRTFNLDARVQVSTRDITRYRLAQILTSYPVDGPKLKIRQPKARFKKRRREPTERELEGLRKGNAQRAAAAEEARKRREAARV
jgi:hypothetical protein